MNSRDLPPEPTLLLTLLNPRLPLLPSPPRLLLSLQVALATDASPGATHLVPVVGGGSLCPSGPLSVPPNWSVSANKGARGALRPCVLLRPGQHLIPRAQDTIDSLVLPTDREGSEQGPYPE